MSRREKMPELLGSPMRIAIVAWIVLLSVSVVGCERWELDQRMGELCKTDGGIRVFETVRLPSEMFDQSGDPFPGWRQRRAENRLGDDFRLIDETSYLKRGDPLKGEGELRRTHWKIIRKSDAKVLGEGT